MRKFDFYEFTGVFIPGVVLLFGFSRIMPNAWGFAYTKEVSVAEFGLFTLLSYATGHMIQSLGNRLEPFAWQLFGDKGEFLWFRSLGSSETPIDRFRKNPATLLHDIQINAMRTKARQLWGFELPAFDSLSKEQWGAIHRQIYAEVQRAGRAERCIIFSSNYAMMRGLLASFVVLLIAYPTLALFSSSVAMSSRGLFWMLLLAFGCMAAVQRMTQFSRYSAREILIQFLTVRIGDQAKPAATETDE